MIIGDTIAIPDSVKELIKDVNPSSIPIKPKKPSIPEPIDISVDSEQYWLQKNPELLSKYKYGTGLGKYGNNSKENIIMLNRLITVIQEMIEFECSQDSKSTEDLQWHFEAISSTMHLLAEKLESKKISSITQINMMATFHGFIESYIKEIIGL